jgi:hypothetical protein
VRYRLSHAEVSEWLAERGILVDQTTIYRWVQRCLPLFGEAARKDRYPVGLDWRVDETYGRIRGPWHSIYRIYRARDGHAQIGGRVPVTDTRHGCHSQVLRRGHRLYWHAAASGYHRQGRRLSTRSCGGRARCAASR